MRRLWSRLAGRLGMTVVVAGLVVVFLGWNGAASHDRVPAQFPYLISGGLAGLALVVLGAALLVVDGARRDRAAIEARLEELRQSLERLAAARAAAGAGNAGAGRSGLPAAAVVAGTTSYHRPECRLLDGRGPLPAIRPADAEARGLAPCRVCAPAAAAGDLGAEAG